jgi:hypothetical protein
LLDTIHGKDASGWNENRCQEHERVKQERRDKRDYDYYGPFYDQLTDSALLKEDAI